jgi:hypothetical protein
MAANDREHRVTVIIARVGGRIVVASGPGSRWATLCWCRANTCRAGSARSAGGWFRSLARLVRRVLHRFPWCWWSHRGRIACPDCGGRGTALLDPGERCIICKGRAS